MDGIACKLPGIISPLLNGAPEAAAPPHTIPNVTQISERVKKLQLRLIVDGCRRAEHCLQPFPQGRELIYVHGIRRSCWETEKYKKYIYCEC